MSKFTSFVKGTFLLPAKVFNGLTDLLFGSYLRNKLGEIRIDDEGKEITSRGILGSLLDGVKFIGRTISNFIHNHKQAIAAAFWVSLALAGAAALTVFLWPAALAAVTTFTIAGFSIAGVVGTGLAAQVGAVAALTAVASSVAVYTVAAIANTINFFRSCIADRRNAVAKDDAASKDDSFSPTDGSKVCNGSKVHLAGLGTKTQADLVAAPAAPAAPAAKATVLATPAPSKKPAAPAATTAAASPAAIFAAPISVAAHRERIEGKAEEKLAPAPR